MYDFRIDRRSHDLRCTVVPQGGLGPLFALPGRFDEDQIQVRRQQRMKDEESQHQQHDRVQTERDATGSELVPPAHPATARFFLGRDR